MNIKAKNLVFFIKRILICLPIWLSPVFLASAATLELVSDENWVSTDNVASVGACPGVLGSAGPDWTEDSFDDSSWRNAVFMVHVPPWFGLPPSHPDVGVFVWDCPFGCLTPVGGPLYGPIHAYFRHFIDIDNDIISALAKFDVDDDFQLYINGVLAHQDLTGGANETGLIDVKAYLQVGRNTFAIHAWDGGSVGGCSAYERIVNQMAMKLVVETKDSTAVDIDIKPGSDPNCFNLNGHGVIPIAILGSEEFDTYDIDVPTLYFNGLEVRVRGKKGPLCNYEDVNNDMYQDLVCHFEDDPDMWEVGSSEGVVKGQMLDGTQIEGTDTICLVP